jgi:murein L,D-transpeptidase YcbB/YkuD
MKPWGELSAIPHPLFAGELKSVVSCPYWNVPLSIQPAEFVPLVERNRSYLIENGYEVVAAQYDVVTIVSDELLARASRRTLFIRQISGPKNALV